MPHPLHVVVADGYADAADSLALVLQVWEHEVRVARTGPEALEVARVYQPDVVLAELCLPGVSGLRLAQALRGRAVLIALTGLSVPAYRRRARAAGFAHFLVKPVDPNDLYKLLQEVAAQGIARCGGPAAHLPALSTQAQEPQKE
jgi:two-component system CheB/CheR fusion protein